MQKIAEVADQELVWSQPARLKQAFELQAANEVVATLQFQRASLAAGEVADQQWTFKREGFWHPQITVRVAGSDANLAVFKPAWTGGGMLELPQGRLLRFGAANFWHSQWDWSDPAGNPLVHFKSHAGLLKTEGEVGIEPVASALPELPLLVVLGWYLLILFARDSAAAAGSTAAVVAASAH
ncbi:MAG: hypothetical protein AUG06_09520 [Actinobacteria bacterium 13_1_20CM_2_65_11]|nr:MAG: hypothetical protein AUG06_09520 [Actinobacteria bacterium 13_1_20CM_2_65_11]